MAANLLPILLYGAVAYAVVSRKKKKKKVRCPPEVALVEVTEAEAETMAKKAWETAGGDPIQAADIVFHQLVPEGCTKKDYKTKATAKWLEDYGPDEWNLSMLYAAWVLGVMDANMDLDDEEQIAQGRAMAQQIATWYSQLTGEPMPDLD